MIVISKLKTVTLSVIAAALLVGCGSGGSSATTSTNISGVISDGPIYGAGVELVDPITNAIIGTSTTSSDVATIGGYSLLVANAPATFVIRATGGTDSGADGVINGNDRVNKSIMKTVALKPTTADEIVSANATPATTLIAGFVENQAAAGENLDLVAAQNTLNTALGLPAGTNLVNADPKTDKVASKAASFVANIIDSLPATSAQSFKSVANIFKEKADAGASLATISADSVTVGTGFSVANIAKDIVKQDATAINASDIAKLEKSDATIKAQIASVVAKSKPVGTMTQADKVQAIASEQTLDILNKEISNTVDASALSVNDLNKLAVKTQAILADVMTASGSDAVDSSNIAVLASVIKQNINKKSTISTDTFTQVASKAKIMTADIASSDASAQDAKVSNSIVENMFAKLDLTTASTLTDTLASVDKVNIADITAIAKTITNKSATASTDTATQGNFRNTMADIVAASITKKLSVATPADTTKLDFTTIAANSVDNSDLINTVTTLATSKAAVEAKVATLQTGETLSADDLSSVLSGDTVIAAISNSFATKDVTFTAATASNFDAIGASVKTTLKSAIDSTVAGESVDVTNTLTAAEASGNLVDATATDFSVDTFDSLSTTMQTAITTAQATGAAGTVDIAATIDALTDNIQTAVDNGTSVTQAASTEGANVGDVIATAVEIPTTDTGTTDTGTTDTGTTDTGTTDTGTTDTGTTDTGTTDTGTTDTETTDTGTTDTGTTDTGTTDTGTDTGTDTTTSSGGGSTPAATTQTVAVTTSGTSDASSLASTYNFTAGTYAYTITGFDNGDVLDFPTGNSPTIINSDFTDGNVTVQWAYNGSVISVNLTIPTADDETMYGLSAFTTAFGASSIQ